jgi:4-aminobutyrate aminotransferase-like enzyme
MQVLIDERLAENAEAMGQLLRSELEDLRSRTSRVKLVRGKGLLNAVVIDERDGVGAWDVCMRLKENGLLVSGLEAASKEVDVFKAWTSVQFAALRQEQGLRGLCLPTILSDLCSGLRCIQQSWFAVVQYC